MVRCLSSVIIGLSVVCVSWKVVVLSGGGNVMLVSMIGVMIELIYGIVNVLLNGFDSEICVNYVVVSGVSLIVIVYCMCVVLVRWCL